MDKFVHKLKADGWNLSAEGLQIIADANVTDYRDVVSNILNCDLKDICQPSLPDHISKQRIGQLVLQIQKIRNVSAPKANEDSQAAPRMLKLTLSDGHSTCQAIEVDPLPDITVHKTAPGTKLLVDGARMQGGYVLLEKACCRNLGGRVQSMYDKWELSKQILKQSRSSGLSGVPPAWVNFGQKIAKAGDVADFKSLVDKSKEPDKDSSEFNAQRQDAIAEAATGAVKKVFGKGKQENVTNKYNLQNDRRNVDNNRRNPRQNRRGRNEDDVEEKISAKPSDKVSLFAFLEDKLPEQPTPAINSNTSYNNPHDSNRGGFNNKYNTYDRKDYQTSSRNTENNKSKDYYDSAAPRAYGYKQNGEGYNSHTGGRTQKPGNDNKDYGRNPRQNNYAENKMNSYEPRNKFDNNSSKRTASVTNKPSTASTDSATSVGALSNDMSKLNVNQQFASRSLQSHLNLNKGTDKVQQSFYNKEDYGNPFSSKFNTTDKKRPVTSLGAPKPTQQTYEMAPVDDFGGPKLYSQSNTIVPKQGSYSAKNVVTEFNSSAGPNNMKPVANSYQNGSTETAGFAFTGWRVGDHCMAKYWEDGRFYNATVTAVTDKTCVVQFNEYGNIEEVLNVDCIPFCNDANIDGHNQNPMKNRNQRNRYFNRTKQ